MLNSVTLKYDVLPHILMFA